jgi:hypothetical protein
MFDLLTNNKMEAAVAYFEVELPDICVVTLVEKTADLLGPSMCRPGFEPSTCGMQFITVTA